MRPQVPPPSIRLLLPLEDLWCPVEGSSYYPQFLRLGGEKTSHHNILFHGDSSEDLNSLIRDEHPFFPLRSSCDPFWEKRWVLIIGSKAKEDWIK